MLKFNTWNLLSIFLFKSAFFLVVEEEEYNKLENDVFLGQLEREICDISDYEDFFSEIYVY